MADYSAMKSMWYFIRATTSSFQVKVKICVQFFKVGEIDTLKEQYTADVIVKAKWREPSLDGQNKTVSNGHTELYFRGGFVFAFVLFSRFPRYA